MFVLGVFFAQKPKKKNPDHYLFCSAEDQAGVGSRLRSKTYGISMGPRTFSSLARLLDWPLKPQTDKVFKKKKKVQGS